jgi:hypothetical protein
MALVIEDGTVVASANSYIDVDAAKAYAAARGVDLGTDDALTEQRLVIAMGYLEAQRYRGDRYSPQEQELAWPRYGVTIDGRYISYDEIPRQLKDAEAQLVIELFNGVELYGSSSSASTKFVKREKVDVLETEYATPQELGQDGLVRIATMPAVDALLHPLLRPMGALTTYRR